jgi:hypothetical protein
MQSLKDHMSEVLSAFDYYVGSLELRTDVVRSELGPLHASLK